MLLTFDAGWLGHVIPMTQAQLTPSIAAKGENAPAGEDDRRVFVTARHLRVFGRFEDINIRLKQLLHLFPSDWLEHLTPFKSSLSYFE